MKKWFALALCLCLMALGCGAMAEEDWNNYECSLDFFAYEEGGGLLRVTQDDWLGGTETGEFGMMGLLGAGDMTVAEVLEHSGVHSFEVIHDADTFEGWMEYEVAELTDEWGFTDWEYVRVSGDTLFTTDEVMAMPLTESGKMFVAKWANIPMEDYFAVQVYDEGEVFSGDWPNTFAFTANGGMIYMTKDREWEADYTEYWVDNGLKVTDVMNEEKDGDDVYFVVEKDGAKFTGWTVYQGDALQWGYDEPVDEYAMCFVHESAAGPDANISIMLTNCTLYGDNVVTEELWEIVCDGTSYYAIANWE